MLLSAVSEVRAASCRTCLALDGTRVLPNQQTAVWAHPRLGSPRGALKSQSVPPRAPGAFARGRRRSRRRAPTAVGRAACSARSTRRSCSCSSSCTAHGSSGTSAAQTTLTRRTWHNPRTPRGHARALARTDDSSVQAHSAAMQCRRNAKAVVVVEHESTLRLLLRVRSYQLQCRRARPRLASRSASLAR